MKDSDAFEHNCYFAFLNYCAVTILLMKHNGGSMAGPVHQGSPGFLREPRSYEDEIRGNFPAYLRAIWGLVAAWDGWDLLLVTVQFCAS